MDKRALRARMRAERDAFVASRPSPIVADERFCERVSAGTIVASYTPMGSETDPRPLERAVSERGGRLALPYVVDKATPLRFLAWEAGAALAPGPFGLANPHPYWEEVSPDLILTPLLAFDAALNRLGQGAGHYDRAFVAHPDAWRVGVAWSVQQVDESPADPWDVPLHAVITETGWLTR